MNNLQIIEKVKQWVKPPDEVMLAKRKVVELLKSGRITDDEFMTLNSAYDKITVNIQSVTIDNRVDNRIDISSGAHISQSAVGAAAMDHELESKRIFWNRSSK